MALPFLRTKEGSASSPVETVERKADEEKLDDMDMLQACAEDMIQAIEKKDVSMLKEALSALVSHIQLLDEEQDKEET